MNLKQLIQERERLFKEKFELESEGCSECGGFELIDTTKVRYPRGDYHCEYDLNGVRQFNQETIKLILEKVVEEIESKKVLYKTTDKEYNETGGPNVAEQYNEALSDLSSHLQEVIKDL